MKHHEFNDLLEKRLSKIRDILGSKNAEYATNDDKLKNFRRAAAMRQVHPARALDGMKVKHDESILTLIESVEKGNLPSKELLSEKITDSIGYLILLEAIIEEERSKKEDSLIVISEGKQYKVEFNQI